MGRKIPAKKHRGIKDPLQQQARRLEGLKPKINAPPKNPDEQPVPRSLTRLFQGSPTHRHKRLTHAERQDDDAQRVSMTPRGLRGLARGAGESTRAFSLRITSAARALTAPDTLRYPNEFEEEDVKGSAMAAHRERRRRRRAGAGMGAGADVERNSRAQRRALERAERREKLAEEAAVVVGAAARRERVPFGEVVDAPPALRPPRLPASFTRHQHPLRPGQRDLLLTRLLPGAVAPPRRQLAQPRHLEPPVCDFSLQKYS